MNQQPMDTTTYDMRFDAAAGGLDFGEFRHVLA
jgi:hypothetical protein